MRWISARKWTTLAALTMGTTFQLTNCGQEAGLFAVRTAFSSLFLPINQLILFFFDIVASAIPSNPFMI